MMHAHPYHSATTHERTAPSEIMPRLFAHRLDLPPSPTPDDAARWPLTGSVCALATADERLVQLISVASLRRALHARLVAQPDAAPTRRATLRGVVRRVWWQPAYSAFEAGLVYLQRARQLLGSAYTEALAFAPAWYAHVDAHADHPRWLATDRPGTNDALCAGPFSTRKQCAAFIADIEDLFDLCRYHDELIRAPYGTRCAYFDMGKCPGPCDGTVSMDAYRMMIAESARFALGNEQLFITRWHQQMQTAARDLAFEKAQRFRDALARAEALAARPGRYARSPQDFRFLIVQRGARRDTLRPFFCNAAAINTGADVRRAEIEPAAAEWAAHFASSDKHAEIAADYRAECIAWVCHHLGKAKKSSGLYLIVQDGLDARFIAQRIEARFFRSCR
jgi:hypothetical protein